MPSRVKRGLPPVPLPPARRGPGRRAPGERLLGRSAVGVRREPSLPQACELQHEAGGDGQQEGGDGLSECGVGNGGEIVRVDLVLSMY